MEVVVLAFFSFSFKKLAEFFSRRFYLIFRDTEKDHIFSEEQRRRFNRIEQVYNVKKIGYNHFQRDSLRHSFEGTHTCEKLSLVGVETILK